MPDWEYTPEHEAEEPKSSASRIVLESIVLLVVLTLILRFGGAHAGGSVESAAIELDWSGALIRAAIVAAIYGALRFLHVRSRSSAYFTDRRRSARRKRPTDL